MNIRPRKGIPRTTHGETREGRWTPEYMAWSGMINRCYVESSGPYSRYGGRGITVCDRWRFSLENFLADMGRKPSAHHSLDRRGNNGDYTPDNCHWTTQDFQNQNRRASSRSGRLEAHEPTQIRWLHTEGVSYKELALFFEISRGMVSMIVNRKTWANVP